MRILMILPALTEATSPFFRPIKYALFPPLGLAALAAHCSDDDDVTIVDEHVMPAVDLRAPPDRSIDLVVIQCYITNAKRAVRIADHFRAHGVRVAMGGLHPTSVPEEIAPHVDHLFLGPGDASFPRFLADLAGGEALPRYDSRDFPRSIEEIPPPRRDLIDRRRYLVPNSIVVTRGCPHHCTFCYKDAFFEGGRGFYTERVDNALAQIEALPGRHLYFLDDHLLGHARFARELFEGMRGMNRVFQGAATVASILRGDLVERAVDAGLRSIFIGFEALDETSLANSCKHHNIGRDYGEAIRRLDALGVMINGSFVFGLDGDDADVFDRTTDWALHAGLTTATFHIATPYPGTRFFEQIEAEGRLRTRDWDLFDTRHAVFEHPTLSADELERGYWRAYKRFYQWRSLFRGARAHEDPIQGAKALAYAGAWKKLEPAWNVLIRTRQLALARPGLERGLDAVRRLARSPRSGSAAIDPPTIDAHVEVATRAT